MFTAVARKRVCPARRLMAWNVFSVRNRFVNLFDSYARKRSRKPLSPKGPLILPLRGHQAAALLKRKLRHIEIEPRIISPRPDGSKWARRSRYRPSRCARQSRTVKSYVALAFRRRHASRQRSVDSKRNLCESTLVSSRYTSVDAGDAHDQSSSTLSMPTYLCPIRASTSPYHRRLPHSGPARRHSAGRA